MTRPSPSADLPAAIAARAARAALVLVVGVGVGGAVVSASACLDPPRDRGTLQAPSEASARARAEAVLQAAIARDAAGVRAGLCPALAAQVPALLEPGQALAIEAFTIAAVEPVWVGGEPAFSVSVELTRNGARLPRGLRVRAREGCVDQLLDAPPVGASPGAAPERDEISL